VLPPPNRTLTIVGDTTATALICATAFASSWLLDVAVELDDAVAAPSLNRKHDAVFDALEMTCASALVKNCNDAVALVMLALTVADPRDIFSATEVVDAVDDTDAVASITNVPTDVIDDEAFALALASLTISALDTVVAAVVVEPMASVISPSKPKARTP
jgi:hypothetical protein